MDNWEEEHICAHLSELIKLTLCSPELLACLKSSIFSEGDIQEINSQTTELGKANLLFRIAFTKTDGYDELIRAFKSTKLTGALKILEDGKKRSSPIVCEAADINCYLPEELKYYINRKLSRRIQLDPKIFNNPLIGDNVFVIDGISIYDLSNINGGLPIANSSTQLNGVTSKFIILNCVDDYEEISKSAKTPVHLIKYDCTSSVSSFVWIKSSKNVECFRLFTKTETEICHEENFSTLIFSHDNPNPRAFILSDSPGMGKTLLASNLARKVQTLGNSLVLFFVLNEFAQKLEAVNSDLSALEQIAMHAVSNTSIVKGKDVTNMFPSSQHFVLFLDGYDEISPEKLANVQTFLTHAKQLQNFAIIVTTRPHLELNLCAALDVLPYEILPFDESDQISFLTKYWVDQHQALEGTNLTNFAEACLKSLKQKMTDEDNKIAGIPLQCWMLAEVYAKDARSYSRVGFGSEFQPRVNGIFDMYKDLVTLKFKRLAEYCPQTDGEKFKDLMKSYKHFHYYESIKLLFPDWIEKLEKHLRLREDVTEKIVHSIGLLEKRGKDGVSQFVHRTFAEYILADFLVKHVNKCSNCIDLLFEVILGSSNEQLVESFTTFKTILPHENAGPSMYKLNHPNIAFFTDHHLKEYLKSHSIDHRLIRLHVSGKELTTEESKRLCMILAACCCNNLENCLDLCEKVILEMDDLNMTSHNHFNHLPHHAVMNSNSMSLIQKVMDLKRYEIIRNNPNFDLFNERNAKWKFIDDYAYPWIPNCTALHLAVYQGNYEITQYLLKLYQEQIHQIRYVIHVCVRNSARNSENVINNKISIIKLLHKNNNVWLKETFSESLCPPLLQYNVHIKLLQTLVELGANINACSDVCGTLLHRSLGRDVVRWAAASGFQLINNAMFFQMPPLVYALISYDQFNDELLDEFIAARADLNGQCEEGNSVLFYAVEKAKAEIVAKILKHKAKVNHKNKHGETVMVRILKRITNDKRNNSEVLRILQSLSKSGFNPISKNSNEYETLLLHFLNKTNCKKLTEDILNFLYEERINFNVCDGAGKSVLYLAIVNECSPCILRKLIECGADVNKKDNKVLKGLNTLIDKSLKASEGNEVIQGNIPGLVEVILSKTFNQINNLDKYGTSILFKMVGFENINPELIDLFNANKADFTLTDTYGNSVLFEAIKHGRGRGVIKKIIEFASSVTHQNNLKENAVHIAVKFANTSALEYLLSHDFYINGVGVDASGNTPLHLVFANTGSFDKQTNYSESKANSNRRHILEILLKRKADLEAKNRFEETPLVSWISSKMWRSILQIFQTTEYLNVDRDIASDCLTAIIMNKTHNLDMFLNSLNSFEDLVKLFNFFIQKGGKICAWKRVQFNWEMLLKPNLWIQLADFEITYEFLQELKKIASINIPMNALNLWCLVYPSNSVKIEEVFLALLTCKNFVSFFKLCNTLRSLRQHYSNDLGLYVLIKN